jgi:hypothetical protein
LAAAATVGARGIFPPLTFSAPANTSNNNTQIFPYHLSEYLCRVSRATPFRYYRELLADALKAERSYDTVPNFTVR